MTEAVLQQLNLGLNGKRVVYRGSYASYCDTTSEQMYEYLVALCPNHVMVAKRLAVTGKVFYEDQTKANLLVKWCESNTTGFWSTLFVFNRDLTTHKIWAFQEAYDAVLFKLMAVT